MTLPAIRAAPWHWGITAPPPCVEPEILARATDDAWLVERAGGKVVVVSASEDNLKITTARDLQLAELLLSARAAARVNPA